ncbi:MAG: type II toxin-antitoxin system RelE/ParE family toxin [bacterium]
MKVLFDESAKKELDEAVDYYEVEVTRLGKRFKKEVRRSIKIIKEMPKLGSLEPKNIRRYILHKFPYKILYSIETDHIYIVAIAHMHREPQYWIRRIKKCPNR